MRAEVSKMIRRISFYDGEMNEDLRLNDDLGFDSLRLVSLIIEIEDELKILFGESDLDPSKINTLGDLYTLIEGYMAEEK